MMCSIQLKNFKQMFKAYKSESIYQKVVKLKSITSNIPNVQMYVHYFRYIP